MATSGAQKHSDRLKRMAKQTAAEITRALYVGGQKLELAMEKGIVSGSVSGAGHVPGPAGGYPNADSRDLDSKIDTKIIASGANPQVNVEAYSDHAVFQQFGTSRMAPRPFASLAAAETRLEIVKLVASAVVRVNRR